MRVAYPLPIPTLAVTPHTGSVAEVGFLVVLVTVLTIGIVLFVRSNLEGAVGATRMQLRQLVDTGGKARAKVLRLDPTGQVVNNITLQCVVQFQMQPLDGSPPFSVNAVPSPAVNSSPLLI